MILFFIIIQLYKPIILVLQMTHKGTRLVKIMDNISKPITGIDTRCGINQQIKNVCQNQS